MDENFNKNYIAPTDPNFQYDKRVDFEAMNEEFADEPDSWDGEGGSELI